MNAYLNAIEYYLPANIVTNTDLVKENSHWDMDLVQSKTGIYSRRIADPDETAFDLSLKACEKLLSAHPELREAIDGIIFCTQGADYLMPGNAFLIHRALSLRERILAYDVNLACSGFGYCLAMAHSFIKSGVLKNILLITADTLSRYVYANDRSTRALFGDAATACWIGQSEIGGIQDVLCTTHGNELDSVYIPAGGARLPKSPETKKEFISLSGNKCSQEHMVMDGFRVLNFVKNRVPYLIMELLEKNGLTVSDIDVFIPHQASRVAIRSLLNTLNMPENMCFSNSAEIGNLGSSSIPIALKDALEAGVIKSGARVLIAGFGAGMSTASAIVDF